MRPGRMRPGRIGPYCCPMEEAFRLLAYLVAALHFAFLGYVVLGGFLAWRWPRSILVHVAVAAWAVVIVAMGPPCPLTGVQDWLRGQAGLPPLSGGFINTHVEGVLYPAGLTPVVQTAAAVVILVSWSGWVIRMRRAHRWARSAGSRPRDPDRPR